MKGGADVNYADVSGKTALHQAASFGNFIQIVPFEIIGSLT